MASWFVWLPLYSVGDPLPICGFLFYMSSTLPRCIVGDPSPSVASWSVASSFLPFPFCQSATIPVGTLLLCTAFMFPLSIVANILQFALSLFCTPLRFSSPISQSLNIASKLPLCIVADLSLISILSSVGFPTHGTQLFCYDCKPVIFNCSIKFETYFQMARFILTIYGIRHPYQNFDIFHLWESAGWAEPF